MMTGIGTPINQSKIPRPMGPSLSAMLTKRVRKAIRRTGWPVVTVVQAALAF